jgi:hypothetical protein
MASLRSRRCLAAKLPTLIPSPKFNSPGWMLKVYGCWPHREVGTLRLETFAAASRLIHARSAADSRPCRTSLAQHSGFALLAHIEGQNLAPEFRQSHARLEPISRHISASLAHDTAASTTRLPQFRFRATIHACFLPGPKKGRGYHEQLRLQETPSNQDKDY